ncbi:MAG TPA: VLRF1 family aeRF1-type release factor [Dysgonamonadaceae bacterium]|nr:VLRF1 family aeRF1-type release factor [Dysgonamonadaceae bacterium]HOV36215.1 VLRF1 family aeRF1-type release factor [Dysgonamonadaceae bacterium]HQG07281.1 VLRF1 family aeRF1-type release factor [Dysgonamonadaceae bacterium]HQI42658.1 VLRF1 family aeRF1-type release factor [Dysgonamonadaceae bacterium]
MISKKDIQQFKKIVGSTDKPILSVYCNVNPANPENYGKGWFIRLKNTLKEMAELDIRLKKEKTFYDELVTFIGQIQTEARTLALFAWINEKGKLSIEHFELQVDLPMVDLASGRIEAHYGKPYLLPILYAFDKYRRIGVLHICGSRWGFYKIFLNEIKEITETFAEITPEEWKEFNENAKIIESGVMEERTFNDKLKFKDRQKAKLQTLTHKLYRRLAEMMEKSVHELEIERLILMGDDWQVKLFENYLNRPLRELVIGHASNPLSIENPSSKDILDRVIPMLREAEDREELQIINEAKSPQGICGLQNVLDALQMGRLQILILPCDLQATVFKCNDGLVFATKEEALDYDSPYEEVSLKEEIFEIAMQYATRIEVVNGASKEILYNELEGIAGLLRW